jgi:glycosyltransferase involved in cell wall biosynthesis
MKPLISIITPLYNHEKYIGKCIESALGQTYVNWEQIIVDDASTDNSFEVASTYSARDKRIKIIRHKKNWGISRLSDTYNQALKAARGRYVAILESDDYWPKNKLEKQVNFMVSKKAVLSYGNCILVSSGGTPINLFTYSYEKNILNNNPTGSILRLFGNLKFSVIPVTVIMRRKELLEVGGFCNDRYYPFTDVPTFLKLALKGRFAYINEVVGFYRKQEISEWYNFASATNAMGREELRDCVNLFLQKHKRHPVCLQILREDYLKSEQSIFIEKKKRWKKLSYFLNTTAFKYNINPLFIFFLNKYIYYKIKKHI